MTILALLGDPFVANIPKQLTNSELIQALRVDIVGEMEAIIGYEAHALAINDERVKKVLFHIADEEKAHVGELQQRIYILCPEDAQHYNKGIQSIQQQQTQNSQAPMQ